MKLLYKYFFLLSDGLEGVESHLIFPSTIFLFAFLPVDIDRFFLHVLQIPTRITTYAERGSMSSAPADIYRL